MKLYLDENLSPKFRHQFDPSSLKIYTFQFMEWQGKKNGELLKLLVENEFRGIITSDKLMYSDEQLKKCRLHFFLVQSVLDTPAARNPLFYLLNNFLLESYAIFEQAESSEVIVTDGIVDKELSRGVHVLWVNG